MAGGELSAHLDSRKRLLILFIKHISPEGSCVPISPTVSVFAYEMTSENLIREINPPG